MGSLNRVQLIGNLGKNPDVRTMDNGNKVASFSIATTEPAYSLANGTNVPERTEWHNVIAWGALAGVAERYLQKGQQVFLEGKLRTRSYEKNQAKHYVTEVMCERITLLGGNSGQNSQYQPQSGTNVPVQEDNTMSGTTANNGGYTDDLPF